MSIQQKMFKVLLSIVLFGLTAYIFGFIKNFFFLKVFDEDVRQIAGLSSHISMLVSIIISCIILIIISFICFTIIELCDFSLSSIEFSNSFKNFVYILIFGEFIKTVIVIIFLDQEIEALVIDSSFTQQLEKTNWYYLNFLVEWAILIFGIFIFMFSFKGWNQYRRVREILGISIIIFISLFMTGNEWL